MTRFQRLVLKMLLAVLEHAYVARVRTDGYASQEQIRKMDKFYFEVEAEVEEALREEG